MRIAVVGAGWAGLASAIRLAEAGHRLTVVDAAPGCGGRARGIASAWQGYLETTAPASDAPAVGPATRGSGLAFDNGQHLVIGAYSALLDLLGRIGLSESAVFERLPFRLDDGGSLVIPGPGLGGLLRARGLSWSLRLALARVLAGIVIGRDRALAAARGKSVTDWSRDNGHPPALLSTFWKPLVISTMNTPIETACAETFVRVLADSLAGGRGASDFLIPHGTLSTAFVDPALAWLRERGVVVRNGCDIRALRRVGTGYRLVAGGDRAGIAAGAARDRNVEGEGGGDKELSGFDGVVVATPPGIAARILGRDSAALTGPLIGLLGQLEAFDYRPITTVYLGWRLPTGGNQASGFRPDADGKVKAKANTPANEGGGPDAWQHLPVATLLHDEAQTRRFGQWLFRRPSQGDWRIGAVVISDSAAAMAQPRDVLARDVSRQLSEVLGLPPAEAYAVLHDKRATIAAVHDRPRLAPEVPDWPGVVLAGDYRYHRYPATLESALRSGIEAAAALEHRPAPASA